MKSTGERYIPAFEGPVAYEECQTAYEHWHRYLYAVAWVKGKAVLDVASGEGYGSACLAEAAARVVGVDQDPEAVAHAARHYQRPNLEFRCGTAEAVPVDGEHQFDVVVSFETIEHLWPNQQEQFLREVVRLLKPGGVALISTPNKQLYTDQPQYRNPFHRREFYYEDFLTTLKEMFRHVRLLGQKVYPASVVWPLDGGAGFQEFQLGAAEGRFAPAKKDQKAALYFLAVCSNEVLEIPPGAVLLDVTDQLTRAHQEAQAKLRQAVDAVSQLQAELARQPAESDRKALAQLQETFRLQVQESEAARREAEKQITMTTQECEASRREIAALQQELQQQAQQRQALQARIKLLENREQELRDMYVEVHEALWRRDEEIRSAAALALRRNVPVIRGPISSSGLVLFPEGSSVAKERLREAVDAVLPLETMLLVAAAGDEDLLHILGRPAEHFPQVNGVYLGPPLNAHEAASRLEELRQARGAQYLIVPAWTAPGLDPNGEFRAHLERCFQPVLAQEDLGFVYAIRWNREELAENRRQFLHRLRSTVAAALPPQAAVLVATGGNADLGQLGDFRAEHFPQEEGGAYAHTPLRAAEAAEQVESMRQHYGFEYLLWPAGVTGFVDLEEPFRQYLESRFEPILAQDDVGILYDLRCTRAEREEQENHRRSAEGLQAAIAATLPAGAAVLVASAGDDGVPPLGDRRVEPFLGSPVNAPEAAERLEEARQASGAQYLLWPAGAAEVLDPGGEFRRYLEDRFPMVPCPPEVGQIFALEEVPSAAVATSELPPGGLTCAGTVPGAAANVNDG